MGMTSNAKNYYSVLHKIKTQRGRRFVYDRMGWAHVFSEYIFRVIKASRANPVYMVRKLIIKVIQRRLLSVYRIVCSPTCSCFDLHIAVVDVFVFSPRIRRENQSECEKRRRTIICVLRVRPLYLCAYGEGKFLRCVALPLKKQNSRI
jgi:hypothetical protein